MLLFEEFVYPPALLLCINKALVDQRPVMHYHPTGWVNSFIAAAFGANRL
jgi:hypothetical protein